MPAAGETENAILRLLDRPLTPELIQDATKRVAQPRPDVDTAVARLLLFRAGGELFAIPAAHVVQVARGVIVSAIPHRSNHLLRGICCVNGQLLLCASLHHLLALPDPPTTSANDLDNDSRRTIVLGKEPEDWAFEVERVLGVTTVETHIFQRPPITVERSIQRYTECLVPRKDGSLAALLDAERVISGFKAGLS